MPRFPRVVAVGYPHHVTQRGNERQEVFRGPGDYKLYLRLVRRYAKQYGVEVMAFCFMPNHVHWVVVPQRQNSFAKAFGRAHAEYSRTIHMEQEVTGHLWENRHHSCVMDEAHCWNALAYVERNPVRAGLCEAAQDWPWSSARVHLGLDLTCGIQMSLYEFRDRYPAVMWEEALRTSLNEAALGQRLREATVSGNPLGDDGFAARLESELGRRVVRGKRGRPPKEKVPRSLTLFSGQGED